MAALLPLPNSSFDNIRHLKHVIDNLPEEVRKTILAPLDQGLLDLNTVFYLKDATGEGDGKVALSAADFIMLISDEISADSSNNDAIPQPLLNALYEAMDRCSEPGYATVNAEENDAYLAPRSLNGNGIKAAKEPDIDCVRPSSNYYSKPPNSTQFSPSMPKEYAPFLTPTSEPHPARFAGNQQDINVLKKRKYLVILLIIGIIALIIIVTALFARSSASKSSNANAELMTDCNDWLHVGKATKDGIYVIHPPGSSRPLDVFCDMTTDGGGWTVFQRRIDNTTAFWSRLWSDYKSGFGSLERNFWLGLDHIHILSAKDENVTLRIELRGNRHICSKVVVNCGSDIFYFGEWSSFLVENEADYYRLHISISKLGNLSAINRPPGNSSAPIDAFHFYNNLRPFTTESFYSSRLQRNNSMRDCFDSYTSGPWWHDEYFCNSRALFDLNGKYDADPGDSHAHNLIWYNGEEWIHPITSEMKLRRTSKMTQRNSF